MMVIGEIGSAFALSLENIKLQRENENLKNEIAKEKTRRLNAEKEVEVLKHEMAHISKGGQIVRH